MTGMKTFFEITFLGLLLFLKKVRADKFTADTQGKTRFVTLSVNSCPSLCTDQVNAGADVGG